MVVIVCLLFVTKVEASNTETQFKFLHTMQQQLIILLLNAHAYGDPLFKMSECFHT